MRTQSVERFFADTKNKSAAFFSWEFKTVAFLKTLDLDLWVCLMLKSPTAEWQLKISNSSRSAPLSPLLQLFTYKLSVKLLLEVFFPLIIVTDVYPSSVIRPLPLFDLHSDLHSYRAISFYPFFLKTFHPNTSASKNITIPRKIFGFVG